MAVPKNLYLHYQDFDINQTSTIRLFNPIHQSSTPSPLVVFIRASGFAFGNINNNNLPCAYIAHKLQCKVAAIEHRLAPEFKFPTPLNDCEQALLWLISQNQSLNINLNHIALWGECSGGGLSAALCHRLSKQGNMPFKHLTLLFPMLNHAIPPEHRKFTNGFMFEEGLVRLITQYYLTPETNKDHVEVSPVFETHFKHFPPTTLSIGEYDTFLDETKLYANLLQKNHIPVTLNIHPGLTHGFTQFYQFIPEVQMILDVLIEEIRNNL